jgi:hypothetical protein
MHKVMSADIFVYLDTVQFSKNGIQNRNQIKSPAGPLWLTIPVKHEFGCSIAQTMVADPKAIKRHWKTIANYYSKTAGFRRWSTELSELFNRDSDSLADLAIASTEWMCEKLQVSTKRIRASQIPGCNGKASMLIAAICQALAADTYLTGTGALTYMDPADFVSIGCEIWVQQWQSFTYDQAYPENGFVPDLSTLDLLLNCPDSAAALIGAAGSWQSKQMIPA